MDSQLQWNLLQDSWLVFTCKDSTQGTLKYLFNPACILHACMHACMLRAPLAVNHACLSCAFLGTNMSPTKALLKMIFLFPRWDMLVPRRVAICFFNLIGWCLSPPLWSKCSSQSSTPILRKQLPRWRCWWKKYQTTTVWMYKTL